MIASRHLVNKKVPINKRETFEKAVLEVSDQRWEHIRTGSKRPEQSQGYKEHGWAKLYPNITIDDIKDVVLDVLLNGWVKQTLLQRGITKISQQIKGFSIDVVYFTAPNGNISITDAWVVDKARH
jgi:hypothetical protein